MSTASNRTSQLGRRINSSKSTGRNRALSRAQQTVVSHDDAYTFALRVAYLQHLLQPRAKRKQYVPGAHRSAQRSNTNVASLVSELSPSNSSNVRLPHSFRTHLEKRLSEVLRGTERLPGYNDPAVKRAFAEAYTVFTEKGFQKSIDKDRKMEPLVLMFYSSATKAAMRGKAPDDDSWKGLPDRHVALFVRLVVSILREQGHDRDRAELISRLTTLENKLLTNDQNLFMDGGQDSGTTVEVVVPLSYDIKDMAMVQTVARIFGLPNSQVQADINANRNIWTEEAALRDLKSYQHRLNSNMSGALRTHDFDIDESFLEWKRSEAPHLSQMMLDILTAKPELAKTSTLAKDKPLPGRPQSMYSEDQAYADLGRMVTSPDSTPFGDFGLSSLAMDEVSSIRTVDESNYTFIPYDPRSFYKSILQYAMTFDHMHMDPDPEVPFTPLSKPSSELLNELCVHWRIPQFSRLIALAEVAVRLFLDQEYTPEKLDTAMESVKNPQPEVKKPPHITNYSAGLSAIDPVRWTEWDLRVYKDTLGSLHDALLRDLYDCLMKCYEPKPPSIGVIMHVLQTHVFEDPLFFRNEETAEEYAETLSQGLRGEAALVYRSYLDKELPASQEDWDFGHVVQLGKAVVKLCDRIRKRYKNNPEILGVNPLTVLVETMFPSFEQDADAVIRRIMAVAEEKGEEIDIQDGFDLYKEMVEIRRIHQASLPNEPFAFHVEDLLVDFVWRWIRLTEDKMEELVDNSIKEDQFQVRTQNPDDIPTDSERHSSSIIDLFMLFNQTTNQVFALEWDNDVHHAKFMTALSKAFAIGLGRYCDVVDQRFIREMDRPTAQAAAASTRTTQEKFFQYAKDAWNTKEKAEPFQFYPESFVKLNNIEYAMQELDKLEKTMNVDACADALRRAEGPKPPVKKSNNYVFTVKVVEAEDLKACDPTGTSDPYVVLCDEYQKRLAKTRIVYRNLNPRWDETVDIAVKGPLNLIATIWDYDAIGDHDFVGRTSIKLDPVHFSDYLPREFWLDLDTQGRILIRVSMEGERDDIQFYFGKAFRHLKRTERDMVRKITDKLTTQINATLSIDYLRSLLKTGIANQVTSLWKKKQPEAPATTANQIEEALQALFTYFDENFAIMKQTLTEATMLAVMTRLWKEVLMAIEGLVVPPLSDKPSPKRPLSQKELDAVYQWLQLLYEFFNFKDERGEELGVPADVLKSPKYHELASLNFFYFETTDNLIRESERMAAATARRQQEALMQGNSLHPHRLSAPASLGAHFSGGPGAFASMGTIRRGKSIMMSRNLGTMRQAKEEKRKESQADPSDDMILRILRMRPEAAGYLRERSRQKERQQAAAAAALIVKNSVNQGWNSGPAFAGPAFGRNNLPRR